MGLIYYWSHKLDPYCECPVQSYFPLSVVCNNHASCRVSSQSIAMSCEVVVPPSKQFPKASVGSRRHQISLRRSLLWRWRQCLLDLRYWDRRHLGSWTTPFINRRVLGGTLSSGGGGMVGGGTSSSPLLEFEPNPVGVRHSWLNKVHKKTFRAKLQKYHTPRRSGAGGYCRAPMHHRTVNRSRTSLTPNSMLHLGKFAEIVSLDVKQFSELKNLCQRSCHWTRKLRRGKKVEETFYCHQSWQHKANERNEMKSF